MRTGSWWCSGKYAVCRKEVLIPLWSSERYLTCSNRALGSNAPVHIEQGSSISLDLGPVLETEAKSGAGGYE